MKLSVFKQALYDRWVILSSNIAFTFQKETAYWANNWMSIFSTVFYTCSMLVFMHVLYANVKSIAGYSRDEMLFFFLIGQISYYQWWFLTIQNFYDFIQDVNRGDLDLILTKPVPALFYISIKRMYFYSMMRDGIPPTLLIGLSINWSNLEFATINVILGILVIFMGQLILHILVFIATVPVIWLGESKKIIKLLLEFEGNANRRIPLQGFGEIGKFTFGCLLPVMLGASFPVAILLNKSDPIFLFTWTLLVLIFMLFLRLAVWKIAIANYTSSSS